MNRAVFFNQLKQHYVDLFVGFGASKLLGALPLW